MRTKEIKAIIFDLGDVVIPYNKTKAAIIFAHLFWAKDRGLIRRYETGEVSFTHDFVDLIEKRSFPLFKEIKPEMRNLILSLKKAYKTAALSNTIKPHKDYMLEHYPLKEMFDYLFFSCEMGMRKPEPEIYTTALDKMNVKPENVIFIDDMKRNVDAAKENGINGILFCSPYALKKNLENLAIEV